MRILNTNKDKVKLEVEYWSKSNKVRYPIPDIKFQIST